ncbi:unnamed protein product [Durusdinium trenchii]|uniref:Uncharacterized protein n=1 Tax=Durusdinium trenchii TaxID=1381693 RepID=A0ABP0RCS7_9DINO
MVGSEAVDGEVLDQGLPVRAPENSRENSQPDSSGFMDKSTIRRGAQFRVQTWERDYHITHDTAMTRIICEVCEDARPTKKTFGVTAAKKTIAEQEPRAFCDSPYGELQRTPLHYAAWHGAKGALVELLKSRATVEIRDLNGRTPLSLSAEAGFTSCCEVLIKAAAQVNSQDQQGRRPLHWCAVAGQLECLKLLIKAGADVSAPDVDGRQPLWWARGPGASAECAEELLQHGAEVDSCDANLHTPLLEALMRSDEAKTSILITHGAEVNHEDQLQQTPLFYVADRGHLPLCQQLLKAKAVPSKAPSGRSPFSIAQARNHQELLPLLQRPVSKRRKSAAATSKLANRKKYQLFCDLEGTSLGPDSEEYQEALREFEMLVKEVQKEAAGSVGV